jgi:hypothetical protein
VRGGQAVKEQFTIKMQEPCSSAPGKRGQMGQ